MIQYSRIAETAGHLESDVLKLSSTLELKSVIESRSILKKKGLQIKNCEFDEGCLSQLKGIPYQLPLEQIDFSENFSFLSDRGVEYLSQCENLPLLAHLNLGDNNLTDRSLQLLGMTPLLRLKVLIIYGNIQITGRGLQALADSTLLTELEELDVHGTSIDDDGVLALLDSKVSSKLQKLNLSINFQRISDGSCYAISNSKFCKNLKSINLDDCAISDRGLGFLAESPNLTHLQELFLNNSIKSLGGRPPPSLNQIGDFGIELLSASKSLQNLRILELRNTSITDRSLKILLSSPIITRLEKLRLSFCSAITENSLPSFFTLATLIGFRKLYINNTSISSSAAQKLSDHLKNVNLIY